MTVETTPAVKTEPKQATYTDEQVARVMEAQKVNRIGAIHMIRRMGFDKALGHAKPTTAPKATTKRAPKTKGEAKAPKYSKDAVIAAWERGRRPNEIAALETAGIKGISPVYVSRILFGNENSGGISKEQAARRKEESKRRDERSKEAEKAAK